MRALVILGVLILLLGSAAWWAGHMDWERYRPELAVQISDALGTDVRLNGPLSITFFPYPKLSAENAELTASGIHIQMPHLRLAAKLWPLLRGRIILSSAYIDKPIITINPDEWQSPRAPEDNVSRTQVRLEDVEIQDGQLDIQLGQSHALMTEIDMQLRAPDWHGPYQATSDFIWQGQEWEFTAQLGIQTPAGTRPANFALHQTDGPHQFAWHGAVQPVPFAMHGDGEWHSTQNNLSLAAEVNLANQVIEIAHGSLSGGDKTLGSVSGHFAVRTNMWQNLDANLSGVSPAWLADLPLLHLRDSWRKMNAFGQLQFHAQNDALTNLQFRAPEITAMLSRNHWHLWGANAADALALWGHPDINAWPDQLTAPFDVKLRETHAGVEIENLRLGKTQSRGTLVAGQLALQTDALGWPTAGAINTWRDVLREMDLQTFALHARQWNLSPFTVGDSTMVLTFNKNTDHLALQTPNLTVTGDFDDDDFKGQVDCKTNHVMQVFRAACDTAQITSDGNQWHFNSMNDADNKIKWDGVFDLASAAWNLHLPFSHGEVSADGKLGQNDFHMNITKLGLEEILPMFLPGAPRGEGDVSGQLRVTADKAEGDITASNLQLSALNLFLDNPAQPGKINSLAAKLNWQGDVLELQQLHTSAPDGTGHASVNLDSGIWHGEWADARSNHVTIDGAADSATAQRYRFIQTTRP